MALLHTTSRKVSPLYTELEADNLRSLDPADGAGLPHRVGQKTLPNISSYHHRKLSREVVVSRGGDPEPASEKGSGSYSPFTGAIYKQVVPGIQKGWNFPTCYQPEAIKSFYSEEPFQDGRGKDDKRCATSWGLDGLSGFEGCVLVSADNTGTQKVSEIHLGPQDIRVHLPALWAVQCPAHLHKTITTSNGTPADAGFPIDNLPGRYPDNEPIEGGIVVPDGDDDAATGVSWIYSKQREVTDDSITTNSILGTLGGLQSDEVLPPRREGAGDHSDMSGATSPGQIVNPAAVTAARQDECRCPSNTSSTSTLSSPATTEDSVTQKVGVIRHTGDFGPASTGGTLVVERSTEDLEWKGHSTTTTRHDNRDGRLHDRVGSSVPRSKDGGTLVPAGETATHKCVRVDGSLAGSTDICEGQPQSKDAYPLKNGQRLSTDLCQPDGRNSLTRPDEDSLRTLGLVPATGNHPVSIALTRHQQPGSGSGIQGDGDVSRVETTHRFVSQDTQFSGALQGRFVCQPSESSTPQIYQLEARPRGNKHGCFPDKLEEPRGICLPSLCTVRQVPPQDKNGAEHGHSGCSHLAEPTMVSHTAGDDGGTSVPPPLVRRHADRSRWATPSTSVPEETKTSRLEDIRRQHTTAGISVETSELLLTGWSKGTNTAYQSGWKRWSGWCARREVNPISCGIQPFLSFITSLFQEGLKYRTINTIRSAVSSTHQPVEGSPIGQHPLVKQLMKGVYNSRPPLPRYTHTWDVNVVLKHIKNLGENKNLSRKILSCKLVVLMAITSANRISELQALDLRFRYYKTNGVLFRLASLTKKRQLGAPLKECFFASFPENEDLCVVQCLKQYETLTESCRKIVPEKAAPLFLSYVKPYSPVTSQRLAHWVKDLLTEAGVDTQMFKAHSTRGATTSAALKRGLHIKDILEMADWSRESTFKKFYCRSSQDNTFVKKVLSNDEQST